MKFAVYTDIHDVTNLQHFDVGQIQFYFWDNKKDFFESLHDIKIAIIQPDYKNLTGFESLCDEFKFCDLVIVTSMELNARILKILKDFDLPNFTFIINGSLNIQLSHAKFVSDLQWVYGTSNWYQDRLKQIHLKNITPFKEKPYKFDVLYGHPRDHRLFVKNYLSQYEHENNWFLQAPFFGNDRQEVNQDYNFSTADFWEDQLEPLPDKDFFCNYHGIEMFVGQVMPYKVYDKTSYSLVCETHTLNDFSFFTEKIAKPILAKRLFVVVSGQHYLRNLRSFGFKTFDCVIDESYDDVEDHKTRWSLALDQVVELCKQDFGFVMEKIAPVLLHNYDTLSRLDVNALHRELETFLILKSFKK